MLNRYHDNMLILRRSAALSCFLLQLACIISTVVSLTMESRRRFQDPSSAPARSSSGIARGAGGGEGESWGLGSGVLAAAQTEKCRQHGVSFLVLFLEPFLGPFSGALTWLCTSAQTGNQNGHQNWYPKRGPQNPQKFGKIRAPIGARTLPAQPKIWPERRPH